jgi:hypothetical protein
MSTTGGESGRLSERGGGSAGAGPSWGGGRLEGAGPSGVGRAGAEGGAGGGGTRGLGGAHAAVAHTSEITRLSIPKYANMTPS